MCCLQVGTRIKTRLRTRFQPASVGLGQETESESLLIPSHQTSGVHDFPPRAVRVIY